MDRKADNRELRRKKTVKAQKEAERLAEIGDPDYDYCSICNVTKLAVFVAPDDIWNKFKPHPPKENVNSCNMCIRLNPPEPKPTGAPFF